MDMDKKQSCLCKRTECLRHGNCTACRAHHATTKNKLPACDRIQSKMSKYLPLWQYLQLDGRPDIRLHFSEIQKILSFSLDHSFLKAKKEADVFGYTVGKISMKEEWVSFNKNIQSEKE